MTVNKNAGEKFPRKPATQL